MKKSVLHLAHLGHKIIDIQGRFFDVKTWVSATPNTFYHSLKGIDITEFINSHDFTLDGNTNLGDREIHMKYEDFIFKSYPSILEFHQSVPYTLYLNS